MNPAPQALGPLGIWAGNGAYPNMLATALIARGHEVVVAGIRGHFQNQLPSGCLRVELFGLGSLSKAARFFNENGVSDIYLAGGIDRRRALFTLRPDRHGFPLIPRALLRGDDSLLTSVARRMESLGPRIGDPRPFIGEALAKEGLEAGPALDDKTRADLNLAFCAAKRLGEKDRGQAVVVFEGNVTALETRMGTDALIRMARRGSVLAKVAKPGQDLRFDIPTIGPKTIENAGAVGIRAISVETGKVLLIDRDRIARLCRERSLSVFGMSRVY